MESLFEMLCLLCICLNCGVNTNLAWVTSPHGPKFHKHTTLFLNVSLAVKRHPTASLYIIMSALYQDIEIRVIAFINQTV